MVTGSRDVLSFLVTSPDVPTIITPVSTRDAPTDRVGNAADWAK